MSVIRFSTTAKGNLPHFSYIFRKMEPLGTEFKNIACYFTGDLIFIEIQREKEGTNNSKYHLQLRAKVSCTKIILEVTKGIVQRDMRGDNRDFSF